MAKTFLFELVITKGRSFEQVVRRYFKLQKDRLNHKSYVFRPGFVEHFSLPKFLVLVGPLYILIIFAENELGLVLLFLYGGVVGSVLFINFVRVFVWYMYSVSFDFCSALKSFFKAL